MEDALREIEQKQRVLVLARDKWGKGVVGLAATRVGEACRRPVVILAYNAEEDVFVGSARSRGDFALHIALQQCHDLLARYGGHAHSAGLTVPAANLEAFRQRINNLAVDFVPPEPEPPLLEIDGEITDGRVLTLSLLQEIDLLEPFGEQNPTPVFMTRGAEVMMVKRVGKDMATLHLDLLLPYCSRPLRCVWFQNGEWGEKLRVGDEVDIAYTPSINEWKGRVSVQLMVKDLKPVTVR
jgi:single-stranded-DNA-specific exonuclease